jgi:hypothetical protein
VAHNRTWTNGAEPGSGIRTYQTCGNPPPGHSCPSLAPALTAPLRPATGPLQRLPPQNTRAVLTPPQARTLAHNPRPNSLPQNTPPYRPSPLPKGRTPRASCRRLGLSWRQKGAQGTPPGHGSQTLPLAETEENIEINKEEMRSPLGEPGDCLCSRDWRGLRLWKWANALSPR